MTCQRRQYQREKQFRDVILTTLVPRLHNVSFAKIELFFCFKKSGPRSIALGCEPLCRPLCELLCKQTCSTKTERRHTTCKSFKTNNVTSMEMQSSQYRSLMRGNVIFAPFSLVPLWKTGLGPFRWAVNQSVTTPANCCTSKRALQRVRGAARHVEDGHTNSVTKSQM